MGGVPDRVWTIGHSTLSFEQLASLLETHRIQLVCDVRAMPRSRRHPQFSDDALARALPERGIAYRHLARLGGWRHARRDSPNMGWRNASFRGYADYALTPEFAAALGELGTLARGQRTAIMCAEALWWRCHRRLISDRLLAAGWEVCHIGSDGRSVPHRLTGFAVIQADGTVIYPGSGSV
jgi:uncharacterized protein (DUF488 family)